ncbi:Maf family protein [Jeotgalibacillus soli]|uniref:dTTP/UTP pyrophosphatase n=1 Tax=Jeotgalibacillus soli TaxID=889306 RepID=A0A0C2RS41_9BACL|nr:Maf family protein [Jeotgalibacillus soli]KIL44559.1 hypothetical protein KP78_35230 [Jeotgalibacillus soli]
MTDIVLASASPRRRELLSYLEIPFIVHPSSFEENFSKDEQPEVAVTRLALAKAKDVAVLYPDKIVIGCDTIVVANSILGKPKDTEEAAEMLRRLSGQTHAVYTGVALVKGERKHCFYERVDVTFWSLTEEQIQHYIASGDPFDKAGSYGIQTGGALFVKKIDGDYYAVVGLPISRLARELKQFQSL